MRSPRFSLDAIPVQYWNEVYRDCALIDAVREVAEELKKSREKVPSDFGALREALEACAEELDTWHCSYAKRRLIDGIPTVPPSRAEQLAQAALADGKEGGE